MRCNGDGGDCNYCAPTSKKMATPLKQPPSPSLPWLSRTTRCSAGSASQGVCEGCFNTLSIQTRQESDGVFKSFNTFDPDSRLNSVPVNFPRNFTPSSKKKTRCRHSSCTLLPLSQAFSDDSVVPILVIKSAQTPNIVPAPSAFLSYPSFLLLLKDLTKDIFLRLGAILYLCAVYLFSN